MVLAWSQGEKNGTVTVEQGTKAGGLQACLNAETCEANVQAGLKIYVRIGTSVLSMKKPLGVVIDSGDPVVEAIGIKPVGRGVRCSQPAAALPGAQARGCSGLERVPRRLVRRA